MAVTDDDVFSWMGTDVPKPEAKATMERVVEAVTANVLRTHTAPTDVTADWDLALIMQSARIWQRKASPGGVISNSEFGVIRVSRFDSDIERMLEPFINWAMA